MSNAPTETIPDDQTAAEIRRNRRDVIREGFKNKTRGEAWFNGISYIGVGYGLVTAVSVFLTWLMRDTKCVIAGMGHTHQCDRCDRLCAACVGVTPLDAQFDKGFHYVLRRQPGSSGNCGWRKSTTERIAARRVNLWD